MLKKTFMLLLIASCAAWAQRPDAPNTVRTLAQPATTATSPQTASYPAVRAIRPHKASPESAGERTVTPGQVIATRKPLDARVSGKRDPFVSPIVERAGGPSVPCRAGKHCLVIDQIVLRGVVRTTEGMIAVVANAANKAYFLRENDPVFNGYVVGITDDAVIFREKTVDRIGRRGAREVVKKVNASAAQS